MKRLKTLLLVLMATMPSFTLSAQLRPELGALVGLNLNSHNASFSQLGQFASCCPEFSGGSSLGFNLGAFYTLPISRAFSLQFRLSYSNDGGVMTYDERSYVADLRDPTGAKVVDAMFHHELTAQLSSIGIAPLVTLRLFGGLDVMAGARFAAVTSSHFTQTETLAEPEDYGSYLGSGRTWVNHDAPIPESNGVRLTAQLGARYVLPINAKKTLFLSPDVQYHIPMTGVASGGDWTVGQFAVSLGVGWVLGSEDILDTIPDVHVAPPPPVIYTSPQPLATLKVFSIDEDGSEKPASEIVIEETKVVDMLPLLGYIYFEQGSSEIPERYVTASRKAAADTNNLSVLEAINGMPGIVAKRMMAIPNSQIEIVGTVSMTGTDTELTLALQRATAVRDFMVELGTNPGLLTVSSRRLPKLPTRSSEVAGIEFASAENQRAEVIPQRPAVLSPYHLQSKQYSVKPPILRVELVVESTSGVASKLLQIKSGTTLITDSLLGQKQTDFRLDLRTFDSAKWTDEPFDFSFRVTDSAGTKVAVGQTVPVRLLTVSRKRSERLADVEIERYSLILFSFNDVGIDGDNAKLIDYVKTRIKPNSEVRVIGMTDILGSDDYNRDLSRRRAEEVAKILNLPNVKVEALGKESPRFSNDLPEGRAYNRTVIIEIVNKVGN